MPIAEKLNNLFHAQNVFRLLNCLDKSFLPRRDKSTTLKLLVYGLIVLTIALDLALTIEWPASRLMIEFFNEKNKPKEKGNFAEETSPQRYFNKIKLIFCK